MQTKDGVDLSITYYASSVGKDATPVILLHDYKDTQGMFSSLAQRLQSPGEEDKHASFAVVTVDLRGHGASTKQATPDGSVARDRRGEAWQGRRDRDVADGHGSGSQLSGR